MPHTYEVTTFSTKTKQVHTQTGIDYDTIAQPKDFVAILGTYIGGQANVDSEDQSVISATHHYAEGMLIIVREDNE